MKDHIQYLKYVRRHKWFVFRGFRYTGGSPILAIFHDLSKFFPQEWFPYVHSFYNRDGSKRNVRNADGSYDPTKVSREFDYAWKSHQLHNAHHWQHWVLINDEDDTYPLPIPDKYIREMVADWIGAGIAIAGRADPAPWYERNKYKMILHDESRAKIERLLEIVSEKIADEQRRKK